MSQHKIEIRLGLTGSGKSLNQTEEPVLAALLNNEVVYCSYWINWNGDNYHYFNEFNEVKNLRNCVVVFDEVTDFFDPREWEAEGSEVRRWFRLHRHRHLDIYANTQDISLVAKTIGTLAHNWLWCKENNDSWLMAWILKQFKITRIGIKIAPMTYQELKKMANGWDLGEKVEEVGGFQAIYYNHKKILHHELDDHKIELVHRYCPICEMRQDGITKEELELGKEAALKIWTKKRSQIPKEETKKWVKQDNKGIYHLIEEEFCQRHTTTPLEIRETGLYDTDYEPEVREKKIMVQLMVESTKMQPYKGSLSPRQSQLIEELEK